MIFRALKMEFDAHLIRLTASRGSNPVLLRNSTLAPLLEMEFSHGTLVFLCGYSLP